VWKSYKVAGNEDRNMAVNVAVIKENLVAVSPQAAVVFASSGSEGLQGSGKNERNQMSPGFIKDFI
jgi:hypothetical protein